MVSLVALNRKLEKRLDYISDGFRRAKRARASGMRFDQFVRHEGLVSALWQSWCSFIRGVILESAAGADTTGHGKTTSPYQHLTMDQLRHAAAKAAKRNVVPPTISAIAGFHLEPKWGDVGSGLIDPIQKMTMAAIAIADM